MSNFTSRIAKRIPLKSKVTPDEIKIKIKIMSKIKSTYTWSTAGAGVLDYKQMQADTWPLS